MKKILVIEDNFEVRDNILEILELSGYEVEGAENGKIGIRKALAVKPDLILCDVMMPELDGFGVLKILESKPLTSSIPFIFLTAKAEKTDFRKGMNLGADDYITKPFDDVELLDAIEMRLKKSANLQSMSRPSSGAFINEQKGEQELERLSEHRPIRKLQKKEVLFEEGSHPRYLYHLLSGKVKIFKTNEYGKEFIIGVYGAGEYIGYEALIQACPYTESAAAMDAVEASIIPKDEFLSLLHSSHEFSTHFIKRLAKDVSDKEKQLLQMAYNSIRKRIADTLVRLHEQEESAAISIMRDDLASMAGTAKESAIRTLSEFKGDGLIEIKHGKIKILELDKLKNLPY